MTKGDQRRSALPDGLKHRRDVLITVSGDACALECLIHRSYAVERLPGSFRQLNCEAEVLLSVLQGEAGGIVPVEQQSSFRAEHGVGKGAGIYDLEESLAIKAALQPKCHAFTQRRQ